MRVLKFFRGADRGSIWWLSIAARTKCHFGGGSRETGLTCGFQPLSYPPGGTATVGKMKNMHQCAILLLTCNSKWCCYEDTQMLMWGYPKHCFNKNIPKNSMWWEIARKRSLRWHMCLIRPANYSCFALGWLKMQWNNCGSRHLFGLWASIFESFMALDDPTWNKIEIPHPTISPV